MQAIVDGVWTEDLPGVFPADSAGERLASTDDTVGTNLDLAITDLRDATVSAVEYQRGQHTAESYLYVDPVNGNNGNDGLTKAQAKLTIANAVAAVSQEHTAIIVLGTTAGQQVISENIVLSTRFTFLRGPGLDVQLIGASDATPTITISAAGCEVAGFEVTTLGTGTPDAISVTAEFARFYKLRVLNARRHGVNLQAGTRSEILDCKVEGSGAAGAGNGVRIADSSFVTVDDGTVVTGSADDNILIDPDGGSANDNSIRSSSSSLAGGWGIAVVAGALRNNILGMAFSANTSGDVNDGGTGTVRQGGVLENYGGLVEVDLTRGIAGVSYPVGTAAVRSIAIANARVIADSIGSRILRLHKGTIVLPDSYDDFTFFGVGPEAEVNFNAQDVDGARFDDILLTGAFTGNILASRCRLDDISGIVASTFLGCRLRGTTGILAAAVAHFQACTSDEAGSAAPVLLFPTGSAAEVHCHGFEGALEVQAMDHASSRLELEMKGHVTIGATNTAGTIVLSGVGVLDDSAAGGVTIDSDGFIPEAIQAEIDDFVITQGWVRSLTSPAGSRLRGIISLHQNGNMVSLPDSARLAITATEYNGGAVATLFTASAIAPEAGSGFFQYEEDPLTPTAGGMILFVCTITLSGVGLGTHIGALPVATVDLPSVP